MPPEMWQHFVARYWFLPIECNQTQSKGFQMFQWREQYNTNSKFGTIPLNVVNLSIVTQIHIERKK